MTARHPDASARNWALVWIDSDDAYIVSWNGSNTRTQHLKSSVPVHHRATGGVRHAGGIRPGGGPPSSASEHHREQHLKQFLAAVQTAVPRDASLTIRGPGVLAERLGRMIRRADGRAETDRVVEVRRQAPMTAPQMVAGVRSFAGESPPRRLPGGRPSRGTHRATSRHTRPELDEKDWTID